MATSGTAAAREAVEAPPETTPPERALAPQEAQTAAVTTFSKVHAAQRQSLIEASSEETNTTRYN